MRDDYAVLTNKNGYSIFMYGKTIIRFKAPYYLEKITKIKQ